MISIPMTLLVAPVSGQALITNHLLWSGEDTQHFTAGVSLKLFSHAAQSSLLFVRLSGLFEDQYIILRDEFDDVDFLDNVDLDLEDSEGLILSELDVVVWKVVGEFDHMF